MSTDTTMGFCEPSKRLFRRVSTYIQTDAGSTRKMQREASPQRYIVSLRRAPQSFPEVFPQSDNLIGRMMSQQSSSFASFLSVFCSLAKTRSPLARQSGERTYSYVHSSGKAFSLERSEGNLSSHRKPKTLTQKFDKIYNVLLTTTTPTRKPGKSSRLSLFASLSKSTISGRRRNDSVDDLSTT